MRISDWSSDVCSSDLERAIDDYLRGLEGVYAHADYVTINISSPNTENLRSLQGRDELTELLAALQDGRKALADKHGRDVPMAVKIVPDLTPDEIDAIADTLPRYAIDGIIAPNTTLRSETRRVGKERVNTGKIGS